MPSATERKQLFRQALIEQCEDRHMMAANILGEPDFHLDYIVNQTSSQSIQQTGALMDVFKLSIHRLIIKPVGLVSIPIMV